MPENILDICRLQWDMRGPALFLPFLARFRRDTPSLGNGLLPGRFFRSLPRGYLSPVPKHFQDSLSTSQSTSVAQFTSISFFPPSFSSTSLYPFVFRSENAGVNLVLYTSLNFKRWLFICILEMPIAINNNNRLCLH